MIWKPYIHREFRSRIKLQDPISVLFANFRVLYWQQRRSVFSGNGCIIPVPCGFSYFRNLHIMWNTIMRRQWFYVFRIYVRVPHRIFRPISRQTCLFRLWLRLIRRYVPFDAVNRQISLPDFFFKPVQSHRMFVAVPLYACVPRFAVDLWIFHRMLNAIPLQTCVFRLDFRTFRKQSAWNTIFFDIRLFLFLLYAFQF